MNNENFHPIQIEPPLAHSLHHWDPQTGILRYEYNGVDVITVQVPTGIDLGFRHGSDGSIQSVQYMQQIYLASEIPCTAKITIRLHESSLNMRPSRATREEAILGTLPEMLNYGVNGMYDVQWDLMIDWHGKPWKWTDNLATSEQNGFVLAVFETELSLSALFINLRPWYYAKHLGYHYHRPWEHRPKQEVVAGWCSWEAYRRDIDIKKIQNIALFLKESLQAYGLNYLQVDDGYQAMPLPISGDMDIPQGWLTCDQEKFPEGHNSIVSTIAQNGFSPAIWVNANITNPDFVKSHPDNVIWHEGKPLKGEWIDFLYNCDEQTLATQVEPLFLALKELGYQYIKIDAIRHLLFDGLHECVRLGMMTNKQAEDKFRAFMQATVNGMGKDVYYLASWGEMHEVVGLADACRISMDANPTWAGIRMQLFESARWFHTQRILFLNDPDHVCVRTKPEWAKSILSLISLSGELYMLSDIPEAYTPEKLDIIRKTLPPIQTSAGETGPLTVEYPAYTWTKLHGFAVQSHETPVEMEDVSKEELEHIVGWVPDKHRLNPFSTLWSFAMNHHGLQWRIMLRVATTILKKGAVQLEDLALDPCKTYIAYDFWKEEYLGEVKKELLCDKLDLGYCQVVAFYEKPKQPMLIASNRHVSMDAVSITKHFYKEKTLHLKLNGIIDQKIRYVIYLPDGFKVEQVRGKDCEVVVTSSNTHTCSLEVSFESSEVEVWITME